MKKKRKEKKRKNYTKEFKEEAVKLVTEHGYKISEAARNLGVHKSLLWPWKNTQEDSHTNTNNGIAAILEENKRLKTGNKRLQLEREIKTTSISINQTCHLIWPKGQFEIMQYLIQKQDRG